MRDFAITTESNSDLPVEYLEENDIKVIPHYYSVESTIYGEEKIISNHEFYNEMRRGKKVATMASNPAVIHETFEKIIRSGRDILHISFSSALSSGFENICREAASLKEDYPAANIYVLDSLNASLGEGLLIMKAVNWKKEGLSIKRIFEELEKIKQNVHTLFTVDDLNYLYRGGRLSKSSAILGSVIKIKPILEVNSLGKLVAKMKVRGRKKSLVALVDEMENTIGEYASRQEMIGVVHGDCEAEANNIASMISARFGYEYVLVAPIGPSIGAHSGPGAIGIIYLGEKKKESES